MSKSPDPDVPLSVNTESTASKLLDGEAIVIDVVTGRYYSLEGSGALLWSMAAESASARQIAEEMTRRYEVSEAAALSDIDRVVRELLENDLLVSGTSAAAPSAAAPSRKAEPDERLPYAPPRLEVFTDMEDLLAFDPPMPTAAANVWEAPPRDG